MDLDGIRVLDLTQLLPGPYGSQILADMGAEVIKIEPPSGEPARLVRTQPGWWGHVFPTVNQGKQSVTVDLKSEAGREVFYDMVSQADVVFEQFRPGVVDRLGIDYETLTEYNDDLVYCSLTGFGQTGPDANLAGHDLNYVGRAGLVEMTRSEPGATPTWSGYPVADMGGGMMAATSILGALLSRELGGGGEYIDLAMTDAVLSFGSVEMAMADDGGDPRGCGTPISGGFPWYDVYETSDGRHVTLAALEPRFWRAFCEAVDRPELVEYHMTGDDEELAWLREELTSMFGDQTREEWADRLADADDAMFDVVNTPAEALADPHIRERDLLEPTGEGFRRVRFPGVGREGRRPEDADPGDGGDDVGGGEGGDGVDGGDGGDGVESSARTAGGAPDLGEHTEPFLETLGYEPEEIARLRDEGVI